jgi:prophage maintenance system killer protein
MSVDVFLNCNGVDFQPDEAEAVAVIWDVAARDMTEPQFAAWIEQNSNPKL